MAKKKNENTVLVTRAEKKDATKNLIKELLAVKGYKHNELIDEVSALYAQRFGGEETDNINDVKGRVGSVLDIMKKESDVGYEDGTYMLKARTVLAPPVEKEEEKPVKKPARSRKKKEVPATEAVEAEEVKKEDKPVKKTAKKTKAAPLPPAPVQPIAPVAPITPEIAPEPIPEDEDEDKPTPKKRGRKAKATEKTAEVKAEEKPVEQATEEVKEEQTERVETVAPVVEPAPAPAPVAKTEVMDVSFLLGDRKPVKAEKQENPQPKTEEKPVVEEKLAQKTAEKKPEPKTERKSTREENRGNGNLKRRPAEKPLTADERLCEAFLKRMRTLGGDYFEYYSVYLLERYSMRNGRRLEGLKISGGDHDGGIDGEIELTDRLGFKETIYIQSKNWNPEKGDEKLWVVGETLLQQFIGACACRQAKDGKQHCRGIFITTSRFTPEAKRILEDMSDKIVGYDGADLYEAAKECEFGVIKRNGEWVLDEKLLSGTKAFFHMM